MAYATEHELREEYVKHDRREFLRTIAAGTVAASVGVKGEDQLTTFHQLADHSSIPAPKSRSPKNVLLMICDDLGYGDLHCYGSQLPTPNLDRLADDGMRFTHCTSGHPICSAARGSLLTGRYAQRSDTAPVYFPSSTSGMSLDETTIADLFKDSGYRTKAIGKWHLGSLPQYLPTNRGFESFYGVPWSDDMHPLPLMCDTEILEEDTDPALLTPRYTAEAVRFISTNANQPFFLYLAFSYPHDPANASSRFKHKSGFGLYGDSVQEIDWSVGEIISTLRNLQLLDDTLVIFTSDHGCWFQGDMGPLRGRKSSTFEGGFRVPFIAHWLKSIPRGKISRAWTSNLDVLPTLVSLCNLETPALPLDGIDITSALLKGNEEFERKSILYFTPFSGKGADLHCARMGKWKLRLAQLTGEIYINDYTVGHKSYWLPRTELYDLDLDPGESYNIADLHPDIVQKITEDVKNQMETMPSETQEAFEKLQRNIASPSTPVAATPRPPNAAR